MLKVAVDTMVNLKIARADPKFARALFFKLAIQVISRIKFRSSYLVGTSTTKIQRHHQTKKTAKKAAKRPAAKKTAVKKPAAKKTPKKTAKNPAAKKSVAKKPATM